MQTWLVCFDITNDQCRRRVGLELKAYGLRVQRSVYEISVRSKGELTSLRKSVEELIDGSDDVRFYRLCADCRKGSISVPDGPIADFPLAVVL